MYDSRVFSALSAAADELDIPIHGDAIAQLLAVRDRIDAKLTGAVAEFDRELLWAFEPATSMPAWLRAVTKRHDGDAYRMVDTARKLAEFTKTLRAAA